MSVQTPDRIDLSTPDPTLMPLVLVLVRYLVAGLGVFGVTWATKISQSQIQLMASLSVEIGMVMWALVDKIAGARRAHAIAIMNAARPAGSLPVQPQPKLLGS